MKKKKIIYFPAWVDWDSDIREAKPAKEIKKEKDIFTIIFAGNIGIAQDFPSIIKACELLTKKKLNFRLFIIGDGAMKIWLKKRNYQKRFRRRVILLNKFSLQRMPSLYMLMHCWLAFQIKKFLHKQFQVKFRPT